MTVVEGEPTSWSLYVYDGSSCDTNPTGCELVEGPLAGSLNSFSLNAQDLFGVECIGTIDANLWVALLETEHQTYDELKSRVEPDSGELFNLVNCVEGLVIRGTHNREQIERLEASIDSNFLEIPMLRVRGPELIGQVADALARGGRKADRRPA